MKWTKRNERGSELSLRLIAWLARTAGRSFCRALLYPIVLYFIATDKTARQASKDFHKAVHGRKARAHELIAHFLYFATTLLDRVYLANGEMSRFQLTIENRELVDTALAKGRGCVLLGSHLGSFDFMAFAKKNIDDRPLNIMMRIDPRARLRRLAGIHDTDLKVIPYGVPQSLLVAHQALDNGEVVAILADRVEGRTTELVTFMRHKVFMPAGPYLLAARSNAPILICFGIYEGGNRYRVKFIDPGISLSSGSGKTEIANAAQRYAQILEEQARNHPFNWFNFYPYWHDDQTSQ